MALAWLVLACVAAARAQSNYGSQANNIEYQGEGLPEQTVLDGKVTKLDDLSPVIFLNRTKAALNCAAGSMQMEMKFNEKFYGIAYADFDRHSACQVVGKGATSYKLELPLKGCGTRQDPLRVFTNNIVVRFHPGLEMDGDEVITVVCRYPPPVVPKPVFNPLLAAPEVPSPVRAPIAGTHILLIICAILFLTMLLLGLGVSYLCLRRRALPPPRRLIDDSSASIISRETIQEVKIPRAHPVYPVAAESASVSESIPSDYPSETPSEAEQMVHTNQAFILEESYHSEGYGETIETSQSAARMAAPPAFDVRVRVTRARGAPSPVDSESVTETDGTSLRQTMTIEEYERGESVRTVSPAALPLPARAAHRAPPARPPRPQPVQKAPPPPPPVSRHTEHMQLHEEEHETLMQSLEHAPETPIMPARKPEITSHVVDDVFLRTITEKKTIEDIERHKRLVTEYKQVPAPPPQFDVTIRNHTLPDAQWENFSDISSASGMTLTPKMERVPLSLPRDYNIGPDLFSPELVAGMGSLPELPPAVNPLYRESEPTPLHQYYHVSHHHHHQSSGRELPPAVNPLYRESEPAPLHQYYHLVTESTQLTETERQRWHSLTTNDTSLRRALSSVSSREQLSLVARDPRHAPLFAPHTWQVIMHVLQPPPQQDKPKNRYRKKSEWDSRSRRSSLPTLYEYDSDATSLRDPARSRRSSYRSDHHDMRSMSEMMVSYGREQADSQSEVSGGARLGRDCDSDSEPDHDNSWSRHSLHRSVSQPSLARSNTEVVEQWTHPDPDRTPTPGRRVTGQQGLSTFTSSEVRTFQATRGWRE
ncbi:hypothetical protein JYU34_010775 [Plutella xylostella]|uniref:ZP domain-containing protein n=1 Tax=Plutella xylostella TaxID=51655 RepID=A0ABQ7QFY9_PLUXY|nr:hypothetical protein JYU34_010775 [Plutella xylostella]